MKVTRTIREYVMSEVGKVYDAKTNPYAEQAAEDEKAIETFKDSLVQHQRTVVAEFIDRMGLLQDRWDGVKPYGMCTSVPSFGGALTPAMLKRKEWSAQNQREKGEKIREIIVALELGANREELKRMISEMLEEANHENSNSRLREE